MKNAKTLCPHFFVLAFLLFPVKLFSAASGETTSTQTAPAAFLTTTGISFPPAELTAPQDGAKIRVLSANILLAAKTHEGTPMAWANRRQLCLDVITSVGADLICTQEVLPVQHDDLSAALPGYASFGLAGPEMDGLPRDDYRGVTKNVIYYRRDRFDFVSAGTYWLSETPLLAGSVSWDCLRGRHVNWLRLKDRTTGHEFRVLDAHFDHKGKQGRVEQAKILNTESAQYQPGFPQILVGDLNADQKNPAIAQLKTGGWTDSWTVIHGPADPGATYHAFKGEAHTSASKSGKIDFILCRGAIKPLASQVVRDHQGDLYPSDHYFLWADLEL